MAMDLRKRQKKLERRKAKGKEKQKASLERNPRDLMARIQRSASAPILHCCTTSVLWEQGMSNVLVSRALSSGNVAFAAFLLDTYCLGVKDVTFNITPRANYDRQVYSKLVRDYEIVNLEPNAARKLIEGAVAFARQIGLSPHRDYLKATRIFGNIDVDSCSEEFTYGRDGKPYFVAGPYDSPSRCQQITNLLTDRCGPDGFHCAIPLSGTATLLQIGDEGDVEEISY